MKSQNWLYNYQFKEGIQKSFNGLVYRAAYLNESVIAFEIFNKYLYRTSKLLPGIFSGIVGICLRKK